MKLKKRFIRIFISSTFSDMMQEREYLMKIIFPELRKRCKVRFLEITEVDLRWGIPETDSKEGKVIEICLNEIDKSRPYFIGILGNRYGWIPEAEEYQKHDRIIEEFPWAKSDIDAGLSITEMEIQYGVLRNPAMDGKAFFYLKQGEDGTKEEETSLKKLNSLKRNLKNQDVFPVRDYADIESLGKMILEDLWDQIDRDYPAADIPDEHELEALEQHIFSEEHTRFYKDYNHSIESVKSLLETNRKVLVFSEPGQGKTALLSNLISVLDDDRIVLPYFCGSTPKSNSAENVALFFAESIKRQFGTGLRIPAKAENPADLLSAFLDSIPKETRVLVLIDGLDQLVSASGEDRLQWIPGNLPSNASLLFSTSSESQLAILQKMGFALEMLSSIQPEAIDDITSGYLASYSKKLPDSLLQHIAAFPLAGKPVVLFTLLHELRLFGRHEELESHIAYYTSTGNTDDFFTAYLSSLETDLGDESFNLKGVLTSIHLSVNGLTENEIIGINGISRLRWSQLLNTIGHHLTNRSGILRFSNQYLSKAIQQIYLNEDSRVLHFLQPLLNHFRDRFRKVYGKSGAEELPRILEELPSLCVKANDVKTLRELISYTPALIILAEKYTDKTGLFLGLVRSEYDLQAELTTGLEHYWQSGIPDDEKIRSAFYTGLMLSMHDSPLHAVEFFKKALTIFNQSRTRSTFVLLSLKELSTCYSQLGQYELSSYILGNLLPYQHDEELADMLDLLAQEFKNSGQSAMAEALMKDTVSFFGSRFGSQSLRLAVQYNNLGRVYDGRKEFRLAEEYYLKASEIAYDQVGPDHALYQQIQSNIGILYMSNQRLEEAEEVFLRVLGIRKALYGTMHRLTLKTFNSLGVCKSLQGNTDEASEILEATASMQSELLGPGHNDTLITQANLADCFQKAGKLPQAETLLKAVLESTINQYGEVQEQTINTLMALTDVLAQMEKPDEAVSYYDFAIRLQQAFYGEQHPITGLTRYKRARLKISQNLWNNDDISDFIRWSLYKASQCNESKDLSGSESYYLDIENVVESCLKGNHPAIFDAWDNLAGICHRLKEYAKAAKYCNRIASMAQASYGEGSPAVLEYLTLQAFNLYKDGNRGECFGILQQLGNHHDDLMNFKKQYIVNMYREMLGFFNQLSQLLQRSEAEQPRVEHLYAQVESLTGEAIHDYQAGKTDRSLTLFDQAINHAEELNNSYSMVYPAPFLHKASILEEAGEHGQALELVNAGITHVTRWNAELDERTFYFYKLAAEILIELKQQAEAAEYLRLAHLVNRKQKEYPDQDTLSLNITRLTWLLESEKYEEALELLDESIPLSIRFAGADDQSTKWLQNLKEQLSA